MGGFPLNSDHRFYWRRAAAEFQAAARAVTPAARARRHELAESYVRRLEEAGITFRIDQAALDAERERRGAVQSGGGWEWPSLFETTAVPAE